MNDDAVARRRARGNWTIRRVSLGDRSADASDIIVGASPSELVAMVHQLTLDAWSMAGRELPDYPRSQAAGRVVRPEK